MGADSRDNRAVTSQTRGASGALPTPSTLFARLHAALPQTQCTRCGYPDCAAYAQAIALGQAAINQCPPGGAEGVQRLAAITGQPVRPLNPAHGAEGPRSVAVIDEAWCIGCTLCLPVCPTDAILGSNKVMHTVIEACCTGCALCLPVCPVDCISLENATAERTGWQAWSQADADQALERYVFHSTLFNKDEGQRPKKLKYENRATAPPLVNGDTSVAQPSIAPAATDLVVADQKRTVIEVALALARARAQRQAKP